MSKPTLTQKDILHIADLANLQVKDPEEIARYEKQLSETIQYVENLSELDTTHTLPTSHSTNLTNVFFEDNLENTRGLSVEQATANSQSADQGLFKVKRIMKD